jgi:hypothetical protein
MFENNFFVYSGKIIVQTLGEILYFPIWWYSSGLVLVVKNIGRFLDSQEKNLGFSIWLKNIFVPMYGQRDFASRIISFIMRLIQIIVRGLLLAIWLVLALTFLGAWLLVPPILVVASAFQFWH